MSRFFVNRDLINENDATILMDNIEDINHIVRVLRSREGDELLLCDGKGIDYRCRIGTITKTGISFDILEAFNNRNELPVKVTIFQGLPKSDKMDFIIQKCTELGVSQIVPIETKYTVVKIEDRKSAVKKFERWNRIATEAAKQCNRGVIPEVTLPLNIEDAFDSVKENKNVLNLIAYEKCTNQELKKVFNDNKDIDKINIFIGPEGGFAEEEILSATANNVLPISLGKRILRTETAPLAIMAIVMYNYEGM